MRRRCGRLRRRFLLVLVVAVLEGCLGIPDAAPVMNAVPWTWCDILGCVVLKAVDCEEGMSGRCKRYLYQASRGASDVEVQSPILLTSILAYRCTDPKRMGDLWCETTLAGHLW